MDKQLLDILWVIVASGLVFMMQPGFAALESGMTRSKNSINVAVKNITDMVIAVFLFWLFGYGIMFGTSYFGIFGINDFFPSLELDPKKASFFLFQSMFVATAATIVSGAVAERVRFSAYIYITIIISGFIYPVFGHWVWKTGDTVNGWLAAEGFVDFAGSTVVHSVGGWVALAAVLVVGPRTNRFSSDGKSNKIQGHDLPLAILGTMLLFFGWFGFNGGSTLEMNKSVAVIIVNTLLAGSAGAITTLALGWSIFKIADVSFLINGLLAGLVSITANCHSVTGYEALIIGGIGGAITLSLERLLDRLKIDDVIGAFPVHAGSGVWGTLAVALFGDPEILGTGLGMGAQFLVQLKGVLIAAGWAFGLGYLFLFIINKITLIRVDAEDEHIGLNVAEHGATTEIIELFQAMDEQEKTGDISLRLPVEPFTEIGQIAGKFNKVMEALFISNRERTAIMENISQGLFLLNESGLVASGYSAAFETMIGKNNLANKSFREIMDGVIPDDSLESFQDYFDLMLNISHDESDLANLNPLRKIKAQVGSEFKYLQIRFMRIINDSDVNQLLGSITDITENIKLESKLKETEEKTRREMEKIFQIIHVNAGELANFVSSVRDEISKINSILSYNKDNIEIPVEQFRDKLTNIFACMHSIKGDASMLSLHFFAGTVHEFEDKLHEILQKDEITSEDFLPVLFMVTSIDRDMNEILGFIERLQGFQKAFKESSQDFQETVLSKMEELTETLAEDTGKQVKFEYDVNKNILLPGKYMKLMRDVLIQLVRNSVVHGIEYPNNRAQAGKPLMGKINLSMKDSDGKLHFIYRDDGAGLNLSKIKETAIQKGRYKKDELDSWTTSKIARLIFEPSFSTAGEVTNHAGRGIGMDVIKNRIRDAGGKLNISFSPGKFFEMTIMLPS
jgi:Amt family ammonium transporter